jgi:sulfur carrier protein ThiS
MSVIVQPMGILKEYTGGESKINIPSGITVRQAIQEMGIPSDVVAVVIVNGEIEHKDYLLKDGDFVKLMAIIGGG